MHLRSTLLERLERADPRIIRIAADAGWGKSTFVRTLAALRGSAAIVEAPDTAGAEPYERAVIDALAAAGSGEGPLLDRWSASGGPSLVAFEDVHLLDEAGLDVLRALLRRHAPDRCVVLTTRGALPLPVGRYFAPHEIVSLGGPDLALTEEEGRALIADGATVPDAVIARAMRISRGWPIATLLFARFAREGRLAALLDRLEDRAFEDLHLYLENEALADLSAADLEALALCACARGITVEDVDAVLGPDGVARLDAFAVRQFVLREGDVYHGGLIAAALTRGRPAEVAAMRARCAAARSARGDHCGAAELWLAAGDAPRAAAALDAVGPPQPGVAVSSRYLRLLLAIPLEALLATQHAYVVMLTSPGVAANSPPLYAQARALAERSGANDRNLRVSTLLALAVFAYQASELRRAEELLERLQAEHERELFAPERAAVLAATWAAVASLRGRTVDAAARWDEAQLDAADGSTIYELQRLTLRIGIALSAGESRRLIPDVRRHIAMARASGDPIWIADARVYEAAITRMTVDDDLTTEMVLNAIEREELTAADPAAYRHITRAAELPNDARNILSCLALIGMAYAQHDAATARRMLASAISGLDRMGRTHYQILARLIAARIPGESTARLYEEARTLAAQVQDPRTAASVEAFAAGRMDEVACYPYAVKLVRKARFGVESALRVEILRGRVVRRSEQIALRSREYELLAALALAGTPLARAALATRLWGEDAAEDAGPALRTAVHRLRKQLDDPSALVFENGAYALGPTVTVDVQDIEATLSALRQLPSLTERERDQLRAIARDLAVDPPDVYGAWRWIQPHLAHILELRHRVTVLLAEDALAAGTPDEAVSIADVLLRIEPLDEPVVELAARGLLAAGRRRDAIRRARRYADDLARDLGGEPVSELLRSLAAGPTMAQVR